MLGFHRSHRRFQVILRFDDVLDAVVGISAAQSSSAVLMVSNGTQ
jgi:hypothetical protein